MEHPGKILLEEFMTPLGLTANQVAKGLGVHRSTVGRLIAGTQRLTPELAARLGAYFQVPPKWWLSMQVEHDAKALSEHTEWTQEVTPLELDPDLLLTPKGIIHLGAPSKVVVEAPSIPRDELERLPDASTPQPRSVRVVQYPSGSVALVGDAP